MAIIKDNDVTDGLSGRMGNIVFRTFDGRTIVSSAPRRPQKESLRQKEGRNRFREATDFAKACMLDLKKKEYYWIKARKLNLPNAYTAAITDFLRKPKIDAVKQKGQRVIITADKEAFALASVEVVVSDAGGSILATHKAKQVYKPGDEWEVRLPAAPLIEDQKLTIVAKDWAGNIALFDGSYR